MVTALLVASLLCADDLEHVADAERPIGLHAGLNLGLIVVDAHLDSIYGFVASALGVALITEGEGAVGVMGIGYSFALSPRGETMWMFDLFGEACGGNLAITQNKQDALTGGLGLGVGFRWLHHSGFVLGFKVPVFGAAIANRGIGNVGKSVGFFYLANLISLPLISLGYRF
jgi:hypothetical protein